MKSEKTIEKTLKKEVENLGGVCIKLTTLHFSGLPDRLCLLPGGRAVFVETKSTGDKVRKLQVKVHGKLKKLGFRVELIDSKETLKKFINDSSKFI